MRIYEPDRFDVVPMNKKAELESGHLGSFRNESTAPDKNGAEAIALREERAKLWMERERIRWQRNALAFALAFAVSIIIILY